MYDPAEKVSYAVWDGSCHKMGKTRSHQQQFALWMVTSVKFRRSGGVSLKKNLFFFWDLRFLRYVPGYARSLLGKS